MVLGQGGKRRGWWNRGYSYSNWLEGYEHVFGEFKPVLTHLSDVTHNLAQEIGSVWRIRTFRVVKTPRDGL